MLIFPLSRKTKPRNRGFTLLEMLVVLGLVALVTGLAVGRLSGIFGIEMKKATNKLASTIRYLYDLSITDGTYIRLVFDFENQSYWVEATRDPYLVSASSTFPETEEKEKEKEKEAAEKATAAAEEAGVAEAPAETTTKGAAKLPVSQLEPAPPQFTKMESNLLKPTKLPDGVFFKDIYVEHLGAPVEDGKVAIHFFPSGRVEEAIINLRDKDDERNYSLKINPINGTTSVEWEYRRLEGK